MVDLKTDEGLLTRLKEAARTPATEKEIRRQRESFIIGSLSETSSVTRARVREVLDRHEGRKTA